MLACLIQFAAFSLAIAVRTVLADYRFYQGPRNPLAPLSRRPDKLVTQDSNGKSNSDHRLDLDFYGSVFYSPYNDATFDQYIDHNNPDKGTFPQHYYYNDQFYGGPGFPVVVFTSAELTIDDVGGYVFNDTITGMIAQKIGAGILVLEHRFYGSSQPFNETTVENLQYLTIDQVVADHTRFAREVKLPFDPNRTSNPLESPWIFAGGSYGGSLAIYQQKMDPETYWAYYSSGSIVQSIRDYWYYYVPIQQGMPRNCSCDFSKMVDYVDNIMLHGDSKQQADLKAKFGLQNVTHASDFAFGVFRFIREWQEVRFDEGYGFFYAMCDAIEGFGTNASSTTYPPDDGIGVERALANYAKFYYENILPGFCQSPDPYDTSCYDSLDPNNEIYTNRSLSNPYRAYYWMLCNEPTFYWQNGAPRDRPSLMSRLINSEWWEKQCAIMFPPEGNYTYGSAAGKTTEMFNAKYGGWDYTDMKRTFLVNGEHDPWREATFVSDFRPGGPFQGTKDVRSIIIKNGRHGDDQLLASAKANSDVAAAQKDIVEQFDQWVKEFYEEKGRGTSN